jgi:hypothetical protein
VHKLAIEFTDRCVVFSLFAIATPKKRFKEWLRVNLCRRAAGALVKAVRDLPEGAAINSSYVARVIRTGDIPPTEPPAIVA